MISSRFPLLLVALLAVASPARAQVPDPAARDLFDAAVALVDQGKLEQACPKLAEVVRLDPRSVGAMLRLADCYEQTGRVASAWSTYQAAGEAAGKLGQAERVTYAGERAAALAPRVPRLLIQVAPGARVGGLTVKRDGAVVGEAQWGVAVAVDPGAHVVSASAEGRRSREMPVTVNIGQGVVTVPVEQLDALVAAPRPVAVRRATPLPAPPAAAPRVASRWGAQRVTGVVVGGVGVLSGLASIPVWAVMAASNGDPSCATASTDPASNKACTAAKNAAYDARAAALVLDGVAAVGIGVGVALVATAPRGVELKATASASGLWLQGRW